MKPGRALLLLALAGLACGLFGAEWNTAFMPRCGEDCGAARTGHAINIALLEALAFVVLGILLRAWKTISRLIATLATLTTLALVAHGLGYGLYQQNAPANDHVFVDQEFATAVRLEKDLPELELSQGDRCAMGSWFCDDRPRSIEFHCKGQARKVPESFWPLFKRTPQDDWPGASPELYRDFPENVCANPE